MKSIIGKLVLIALCACDTMEAPFVDHEGVAPAEQDAGNSADASLGEPPGEAGIPVPPGDAGMPVPPVTPDPPIEEARPEFDHFDWVVDGSRGDVDTWASFTYVHRDAENRPVFIDADYRDTGHRVDFWPASVIKIYTVTAALELLNELGYSIDAEATFYHESGSGWAEDTTVSFREMIEAVFDYSSNGYYTLLLRFCGLDWLNTQFLTAENGFSETALMVGYVSERPYRYNEQEAQRIVVREGDRSVERTHEWSGRSYSTDVGCTVGNEDGLANCSSTRDMVEHMRRIIFHEHLPESEQFAIRPADLEWYRYSPTDVLRTRNHGYLDMISRWLPAAEYYHKGGVVSAYKLDLQFIRDPISGLEYITAFATRSSNTNTSKRICDAIARMAIQPDAHLQMATLADGVRSVTAPLRVYSRSVSSLDLIAMDADLPFDLASTEWSVLPGSTRTLEPGEHELTLESDCLDLDGRHHVLARWTAGPTSIVPAYSDYHYVDIDPTASCTR